MCPPQESAHELAAPQDDRDARESLTLNVIFFIGFAVEQGRFSLGQVSDGGTG
jgi:hypothetical protein